MFIQDKEGPRYEAHKTQGLPMYQCRHTKIGVNY